MRRRGYIISINKDIALGTIVDTNEQEINFLIRELIFVPLINQEITFIIEMTESGLIATDIELKTESK
ncbi:hypothetical protein [Pedobacter jejuensis]|uniref:Uncharacterized protein n=1 Tax=Pedobacter jejuensis TaxID=1268550 RepID=A0A3N0BST4_9SPHI|nr:hypothetical protein [Pedobacter jejuensis]RNL52149.1 hypothetical protein D7004_11225 [Pedobacter jejuensis]